MSSLDDTAQSNAPMRRVFPLIAVAVALGATPTAWAQSADNAPLVLDPVTVTATRHAERAFGVPASVDTIDARAIHDGQPQVQLSETLVRIPGVCAANRQKYAQDVQVSSRGFGAR